MRRALLPSGRVRLYGTNKFQILEEQLIKSEIFKADSKNHIHHINHNKSDNRIENLEVLSQSEHAKYHLNDLLKEGKIKWDHLDLYRGKFALKGEDHPHYIKTSKISLLRMLARAKGRPTYVDMDFETFKKKCKEAGIDLKKACARYNSAGEYINITRLLNEDYKTLKVGYYTRLKLLNERSISLNHLWLKSYDAGYHEVYDLEVEDSHNFIASEICVHNCNRPNIQNIPKS